MGIKLKHEKVPKYDLTEDQKKELIEKFTEATAKHALSLFMMLDLKTHIECMVVNDFDGSEYVLTFKTLNQHLKDRLKKEPPKK